MSPWDQLERELEAWSDDRPATFWWRDDDARGPHRGLKRLITVTTRLGVPVALSVIPGLATRSLADLLSPRDSITVLQHGWRHRNHAPPGEARCELHPSRPTEAMLAELAAGRRRLEELFGDRFRSVLVPPHGRIAPMLLPRLHEVGFTGLSLGGPRQAASAHRLWQANVHVDPVAWSEAGTTFGSRLGRRIAGRLGWSRPAPPFLGVERTLAQIVAHLAARRSGAVDPTEPTGLMTHHRVHQAAAWSFVEELVARTLAHPQVSWLGADALFPQGGPAG